MPFQAIGLEKNPPILFQMPKQPDQTLQVAIYGVPRLLDYLPPPDTPLVDCTPGKRALVEVGGRKRMGLIISQGPGDCPPEKIKPCLALPDAAPLLDAAMLELLIWSSDYYLCDPGTAMHAVLPKSVRNAAAEDFADQWELNIQALEKAGKLTRTQQQAVKYFVANQGRLGRRQLKAVHPGTRRSLRRAGIIHPLPVGDNHATRNPRDLQNLAAASLREGEPIMLNEQQSEAAERILATPGFACTLLYGVTGSGKTQVYLELVRRVLAQGKQALVLVPEIGLTPQTLARFERHFAGLIAVVHSSLSEGDRAETWRNAASGEAMLVIGTRSAVFSPCLRLGLIVVDEEHDGSFKQQSGFRYNARDLAILRAQTTACPVVLGSATPQLTTLYRAERGQFEQIRFHQRATSVPMPDIALLDMRGLPARQFLAPAALKAIANELERGKQALVFLNRRGFAPLLQCRDCGWQAMCRHCDSRMTLHQFPSGLICHHCDDHQPIPPRCPQCGAPSLQTLGSGTQHIAGYLQREFPSTQVLRIDRDSVGGKGRLEAALGNMSKRQVVILVGTQMLAKGHDFAHLGLVVVVEADNGLFSSDFRAPEVTLQLLLQVAGRAGRSGEQGRVLIQTTQPQASYFRYLANTDYDGLAELLLQERRKYHFPPYNSLILLRARHRNQQQLQAFMKQAKRALNTLAIGVTHLRVFGPAPPALGKIAGVWQEQILLFHPNRKALRQLCKRWYEQLGAIKPACQWNFDVDPYEVV